MSKNKLKEFILVLLYLLVVVAANFSNHDLRMVGWFGILLSGKELLVEFLTIAKTGKLYINILGARERNHTICQINYLDRFAHVEDEYFTSLTHCACFEHKLTRLGDEHEVANIYNAVDLFAIPSLEENLPNMIMEAMACGVPCVGFNVGGIPEMIDHLHNGYVAQYKSSEDFANGIHWILTEPEYNELSAQACRKVLGNYSESIVAKKYTDVYNKITGKYA